MSQINQNVVSSQQVLKVEDLRYEVDGKTERVKLIHRIVNNQKEIELLFESDEEADHEKTSNQTEDVEIVPRSSAQSVDFVCEEVDAQVVEYSTDEDPTDKVIIVADVDLVDGPEAQPFSTEDSSLEVPQIEKVEKNIPSKPKSAANQQAMAEQTEDHSLLRKLISEINEIFDQANEAPAEVEQQKPEHASHQSSGPKSLRKVGTKQCDHCCYKSKYSSKFIKHMLSVHTFDPLLCTICGKQFSNNAKMQLHRKRTHQIKYRKNLNSHLAVEHNAKSKSKKNIGIITICAICQVDYKTSKRLRLHEKVVHEKRFICDKCGYKIAFKSRLINHMGTHNSDKKFKCKVCLKKFQSFASLSVHVQNLHREKKHKCQECDAAFPIKSKLNEHVNVKHKGGRYRCSIAECTFKSMHRTDVGRHLKRIHNLTGE